METVIDNETIASDVADPEPWYDALFNQVCAGQEMTKSVLFGTQSDIGFSD